MKNLLIKLLACILVATMMFTFAACNDTTDTDPDPDSNPNTEESGGNKEDPWGDEGDEEECTEHVDEDGDLLCDTCGAAVEAVPECEEHIDTDGDVICDVCGAEVPFVAPEYPLWQVKRGNGFFKMPQDGSYEFTFKCDGQGKTYHWPVVTIDWDTAKPAVYEEGVIEAVITPTANIGIAFGATGLELAADNTANPWHLDGVKLYYAEFVAPGKIVLYVDDKEENGAAAEGTFFKIIQEVAIADIDASYDPTADVTIKVEFTKSGNITVWVNGNEAISVEGYLPMGTQIGMMVDSGSGFTNNEDGILCTVKDFNYGYLLP